MECDPTPQNTDTTAQSNEPQSEETHLQRRRREISEWNRIMRIEGECALKDIDLILKLESSLPLERRPRLTGAPIQRTGELPSYQESFMQIWVQKQAEERQTEPSYDGRVLRIWHQCDTRNEEFAIIVRDRLSDLNVPDPLPLRHLIKEIHPPPAYTDLSLGFFRWFFKGAFDKEDLERRIRRVESDIAAHLSQKMHSMPQTEAVCESHKLPLRTYTCHHGPNAGRRFVRCQVMPFESKCKTFEWIDP